MENQGARGAPTIRFADQKQNSVTQEKTELHELNIYDIQPSTCQQIFAVFLSHVEQILSVFIINAVITLSFGTTAYRISIVVKKLFKTVIHQKHSLHHKDWKGLLLDFSFVIYTGSHGLVIFS